MGRKNRNATRSNRRGRFPISKGAHFIYQVDEYDTEPTVVRYLGEQQEDSLLVYHPAGFALWVHCSQLHRARRA